MTNEIACNSKENAFVLAKILLQEGYVVMLSKEAGLTMVNYIWSQHDADRKDVKFMSTDDFEKFLFYENNE